MDFDKLQKELKTLVAQDELAKALQGLLEFCQSTDGNLLDLENSVILNQGNLDRLEKQKLEATIDVSNYQVEKNKISSALLTLIDTAGEQIKNPSENIPSPNVAQPPAPTGPGIHDKIFVSIILIALVGFILAFFYLTIFDNNPLSGSVFLVAAAMDCLVYLNWQKRARMLQAGL